MLKRLEQLDPLIESLKNQNEDLRISNSFYLLRVAALIDRTLDNGYRKIKLKRIQIMILSFMLANGGTITPTELKSKVFRSDNAISKSLDNLDKLGLTRSSGTKADRRIRQVKLTEKGLEVIKEMLPVRKMIFSDATGILSKKESEELQAILRKLIDHLLQMSSSKTLNNKDKLIF